MADDTMPDEHFDVLIVGAGLSGVDAAWHLQKQSPGRSYVILENRERIGGTWDLFRYPGIRSDSDMLTMGYSFRPWTHPSAISPGDAIRDYITDTARDAGIDRRIRFRHKVVRASWDSRTARWTVEAERRPTRPGPGSNAQGEAVAPRDDEESNLLRKFLPASWAYAIARWRNILFQRYFFNLARSNPARMKKMLEKGVRKELGPDYDIATHFTPKYNPWEQRLCLVPDADLVVAIRQGRASVVTDLIETFTDNGIKLRSGREIAADILVTATGIQLEILGGVEVGVDGSKVDFGKAYTYKGVMFSDVPNLASVFGYTNASWPLRADLVCEYVCRLNHMDAKGVTIATPRLREAGMAPEPWLDFSSGYVQRSLAMLPKQGPKAPWRQSQNYLADIRTMRRAPIEDGVLEFSNPKPAGSTQPSRLAAD